MVDGQCAEVAFHADQIFLPKQIIVAGLAVADETRAIDVGIVVVVAVDVRERRPNPGIAGGIEAVPVMVRGQHLPVEERQAVPVAVKAVIQPGFDDLETVRKIRRHIGRPAERIGQKDMIAAAVDVEIFGLYRPIARQLGFDAGAEHAAARRGGTGHRRPSCRAVAAECIVDMDKTDAAGDIDQRRTGDEARAPAQRRERFFSLTLKPPWSRALNNWPPPR